MATSHRTNGHADKGHVVDLESPDAGDAGAPAAAPYKFTWLDPHPIFVIILVGPGEQPFGIQKDFLCAKSTYFRNHFEQNQQEQIEHVVHLPKTPVEVFACAQNFIYTAKVFPTIEDLPSYDILIGAWKLGHELGIDGLCDATLSAMNECRRVTQHIPATPLLVQVWKDTPEGSSIRKLLLEWAAEYMRSSDSRAEFARSLPQEVLSELVVAMSSLEAPAAPANHHHAHAAPPVSPELAAPVPNNSNNNNNNHHHQRKNVHYVDDAGEIEEVTSRPRRISALNVNQNFSTEQKLEFCADLLTRMLSGPGFWTRLVGPFKEAVDPVRDEVPDYLARIKRPMDLGTMKAKMDAREYKTEIEFLEDMHQIFTNCYTYWTKKDPMWGACEKLERTFEEKYSQMNKWIAKMEGVEA
ncbi:hypothetical protein MAPG_05178 [Magnaporthiopsis poae ATCC 64411]|uniref:Bromo domain-containing protein n=1 Tax=Magnaporthiopsis poae (strain ATCC 64411 / 73-15) TaxID=644358 RepID=A0A0C4DYQ2_MAGP6|nr:hypothetical protein MAPG_05178 [Magnaporthiopsis poae ATCC 64411]